MKIAIIVLSLVVGLLGGNLLWRATVPAPRGEMHHDAAWMKSYYGW